MIDILILDRTTGRFTSNPRTELLSDYCAKPDNIVWVNVAAPTDADFELLEHEFRFHHLAIEDCRHGHQRPKIEEHHGYYYIVLYEAGTDSDGNLVLRELNLFLGRNYLVTLHTQPLQSIATVERIWRSRTDQADFGHGMLTYLLTDTIVDDYMPILDAMSDRLDDLQESIFEEFHQDALREIFRIKKQLLLLRRAVVPLRDVFNVLMRHEQPLFPRETLIYFQDVYDHLIRIADTIDTLREIVTSTMDAFLTVSGNRMNFVMKRLTSISAILMSVTLVAGIYGMNFAVMPELGWRYGYVGALGVMLGLAVALYIYFRRINWL